MAKKLLSIIALISLAVINFLYYNEFIGESRVFVINGKSSGVISCDYKDWAFCDGVSFEIHKTRTQFLNGLNAKLVAVEEVGNVINYYYYSKKIAKKEVVGGRMVNIHIAVRGEQSLVGIPFIYSGY